MPFRYLFPDDGTAAPRVAAVAPRAILTPHPTDATLEAVVDDQDQRTLDRALPIAPLEFGPTSQLRSQLTVALRVADLNRISAAATKAEVDTILDELGLAADAAPVIDLRL